MRRILIAFGLIWIFLWCVVGMYLGSQHLPYTNEMRELAQGGNLEEFWNTWNAYKMHASAHAHALCSSFLLILVALVMPDMRFSDKTRKILGVLLIVGVVLGSISGWLKFMPLMALGDVLVAAMVLMSFIGIIKRSKEEQQSQSGQV